MANLKEIRNRITSVNSTMQITSAMKMVSAAKLKRAQDAITQMRPYAQKLQEILGNLTSSLDTSDNVYAQERDLKNVLIVGINSNRGLCGGFNNNVAKEVKRIAAQHKDSSVSILPIGKKMADSVKGTDFVITDETMPSNTEELWGDLSFDNVSEVAQTLMDKFENGVIDKIVIVYNAFKNSGVQIVTTDNFFLFSPTEQADGKESVDYIFEPSKEEIVNNLIPSSLKTQLYKVMLDSHAAEHGARMTAMHKATDNATDLKKELQLFYNKARQTAITNEILEIVGGAEALNE